MALSFMNVQRPIIKIVTQGPFLADANNRKTNDCCLGNNVIT